MVDPRPGAGTIIGSEIVAKAPADGYTLLMSPGTLTTNPATSAVNKYLQSWDVPNVFVVGGSAFPQQSANAPTGTIGALACWAADAIKEHYLKRPGALLGN